MVEIRYLGLSSFVVKSKNAVVIFDPFDPNVVGLPFKGPEADVVVISHDHQDHNFVKGVPGQPYVIKGPGEYEIKGVKATGLTAFHDDVNGEKRGRNTIYGLRLDDVFLCHLGDLGHKLLESQLTDLEEVDVLFIPVGGFYTIDPKTAVEVISQIEPKMVIPMHYRTPKMKAAFDNLATVEEFVKEIGENPRFEKSLRIGRENLNLEGVSLVILENTAL